jgi:hypothetical protein
MSATLRHLMMVLGLVSASCSFVVDTDQYVGSDTPAEGTDSAEPGPDPNLRMPRPKPDAGDTPSDAGAGAQDAGASDAAPADAEVGDGAAGEAGPDASP